MSTIMVAVILIVCTVLICVVFNILHKGNERKQKEILLTTFMAAGSRRGLLFSGQEILRTKIFGLDSLSRTLLIVEHAHTDNITCIKMSEVKSCRVTKSYDKVNTGNGRGDRVEKHLSSIDLTFIFKTTNETFSLVFYQSNINSLYEVSELEAKAKGWENLLSGFISEEQKERA